jgi:hypothetical protein
VGPSLGSPTRPTRGPPACAHGHAGACRANPAAGKGGRRPPATRGASAPPGAGCADGPAPHGARRPRDHGRPPALASPQPRLAPCAEPGPPPGASPGGAWRGSPTLGSSVASKPTSGARWSAGAASQARLSARRHTHSALPVGRPQAARRHGVSVVFGGGGAPVHPRWPPPPARPPGGRPTPASSSTAGPRVGDGRRGRRPALLRQRGCDAGRRGQCRGGAPRHSPCPLLRRPPGAGGGHAGVSGRRACPAGSGCGDAPAPPRGVARERAWPSVPPVCTRGYPGTAPLSQSRWWTTRLGVGLKRSVDEFSGERRAANKDSTPINRCRAPASMEPQPQ